MTRILTMVLFALLLAIASSGCRREETPPYPTSFVDDKVQATRIGRYLQDSVAPKLRGCWNQLRGEGAVAIDLTFKKSGSDWMFDNSSVRKSSLADEQDATAQRCMDEAARGTVFPVDQKEGLETASPQFVVRLGWSVPLPAEGTQMTNDQIARMIGGSGGGGVITVPGCSACVSRKEYPYGLKCESRRSGSDKDCEEINSNTCATTPTSCLRGAFSGTGGVFIF